MKNFMIIFFASLTTFGSWLHVSGASQLSLNSVREQQPINYSGTLKKVSGASYVVEDISISGAIADIPVYKCPLSLAKSPTLDTEFINLARVKMIRRDQKYVQASAIAKTEEENKNSTSRYRRRKIRTPEALALEGIVTYNGRDYIEIMVSFASGIEDAYLIELSKEIWCNRIDTDTRKEVSFEVLDKLIIDRAQTT